MAGHPLDGSDPVIRDEDSRAEIIERAFDYRGDVTIVMADGRAITGYLYNRNRETASPYAQMYDPAGASHTIRYADIIAVRFTGRDMAAGRSYEAWLERRGAQTS